jgi:hypothetical protein
MAWSFCQGVALAGNTCAGVGDFSMKWIRGKSSTDSNPKPGMAGDDQPPDSRGPLALYHVTYITSSVSIFNPWDPDLHNLIIKAYADAANDVAQRAVDRFIRNANPASGSFSSALFDFRTPATRVAITQVLPLPKKPVAPLGVADIAGNNIELGYLKCTAEMASATGAGRSQGLDFIAPSTYEETAIMNTLNWRWNTYAFDFYRAPYIGYYLTGVAYCNRANGVSIPYLISNADMNYTDVL